MFVSVDVKELTKLRKNSGLTKHKLSLLAGLPSNALSRLESESTINNRTSLLRLNAIADVLNVDVYRLIVKEQKRNGI